MTAKLLLLAAFVVSMLLMSFNYGKRRNKIVFFGDSITEFGVRFKGYISLLRRLIKQDGEEEKYELTGAGVGGDTIQDCLLRVDKDVLSKGADMVVVFIGVNDAWNLQRTIVTDTKRFEDLYIALIEKLKIAECKIVLCTPAVIGEQKDYSAFDEYLDKYSEIIRQLAEINGFPLVDLRTAFLNYNLENNIYNDQEGILTIDGVHLDDRGNQLVAEEMWKVIKDVKL